MLSSKQEMIKEESIALELTYAESLYLYSYFKERSRVVTRGCPIDDCRDIRNDCDGCKYSEEFHYYNGRCVRRKTKDN